MMNTIAGLLQATQGKRPLGRPYEVVCHAYTRDRYGVAHKNGGPGRCDDCTRPCWISRHNHPADTPGNRTAVEQSTAAATVHGRHGRIAACRWCRHGQLRADGRLVYCTLGHMDRPMSPAYRQLRRPYCAREKGGLVDFAWRDE